MGQGVCVQQVFMGGAPFLPRLTPPESQPLFSTLAGGRTLCLLSANPPQAPSTCTVKATAFPRTYRPHTFVPGHLPWAL